MYDNMDPNGFPGTEKPGLKGIKVLTTLSIIGCAFQFISALWAFFGAKFSYEMAKAQTEQMANTEMPGVAKLFIGNAGDMLEMARINYENRVPIVLLSIVGIGLCFYGVLLMRKLNRQGFNYYVIGELLPIVTSAIFVGELFLKGITFYISMIIPVVFITLYAVRRKFMVNEE